MRAGQLLCVTMTLASMAAFGTEARAQSLLPATAALGKTEVPKQVVSGSPLSFVFGALSAEYERAATHLTTIGGAATLYDVGEWSYTSAEGKWRYYPNGALRGFSIGATAGLSRVAADGVECDEWECRGASGSATAATFGLQLDYQWFLGLKKNFVVATGLGAKKLTFIGEGLDGAAVTLPTVRLGIGYGF